MGAGKVDWWTKAHALQAWWPEFGPGTPEPLEWDERQRKEAGNIVAQLVWNMIETPWINKVGGEKQLPRVILYSPHKLVECATPVTHASYMQQYEG